MTGTLSGSNFDAATQEIVTSSFEPLPPGAYKVAITGSELKTARDKASTYIALELVVIDGEHQNRKLWDRLTWTHSTKPKGQARGRSDFAKICNAVGISRPNDTSELHDKPVGAVVGIEKGTNGYADRNSIKDYLPLSELKAQLDEGSAEKPPWMS